MHINFIRFFIKFEDGMSYGPWRMLDSDLVLARFLKQDECDDGKITFSSVMGIIGFVDSFFLQFDHTGVWSAIIICDSGIAERF